ADEISVFKIKKARPERLGLFVFAIFLWLRSEGQPQRQLHLPRIEDRPRRAIPRIRRAFLKTLRGRTALCRRVERTEIRRPIDGVEILHVHGVEQVEGFSNGFNAEALAGLENARQAKINRLVAIALEGVARLNTHTVIVAKDIAIGVKAGKLNE